MVAAIMLPSKACVDRTKSVMLMAYEFSVDSCLVMCSVGLTKETHAAALGVSWESCKQWAAKTEITL